MSADNVTPILSTRTASVDTSGDESFVKLLELEGELSAVLGDIPNAALGYPLTDAATCQELREAASSLQRAVDLLTQALDRENPRYNAISDLIGVDPVWWTVLSL